MNEKGVFTGYASIFGNIDENDDVVERGAFKRTLDHGGGQVPVLWQHDIREPIGVGLEMMEDERGLWVKSAINLDTQRGKEAYSLLKQGALKGLSIGYTVIKDSIEKGVRYIKEIRLWEISIVTFPANPEALISDVKTVIPFQNLPFAPEDRAWDKQEAERRVRTWADAESGPNSQYRRAFVWYDVEAADQFGAYKLMIADVIDGRLTAIPRGIFAAAAVIQGARGGVNIPESDIPGVKRHLARYYQKLDRTPPWEESAASKIITDIKALLTEIKTYAQQGPGRDVIGDSGIHSLMETMKSIRNYAQGG